MVFRLSYSFILCTDAILSHATSLSLSLSLSLPPSLSPSLLLPTLKYLPHFLFADQPVNDAAFFPLHPNLILLSSDTDGYGLQTYDVSGSNATLVGTYPSTSLSLSLSPSLSCPYFASI